MSLRIRVQSEIISPKKEKSLPILLNILPEKLLHEEPYGFRAFSGVPFRRVRQEERRGQRRHEEHSRRLINTDYGALNTLLKSLGIISSNVNWTPSPVVSWLESEA